VAPCCAVLFLGWRLFFAGSEEPDFVTARVARGDFERTVEASGALSTCAAHWTWWSGNMRWARSPAFR